MSGGAGGSILAMILSLKNNKAILPRRKSFREIREIYTSSTYNHKLFNKKSDPEFLKALRKQLIVERRKELLKRLSIICISVILAIGLFIIPLLIFKQFGNTSTQGSGENYIKKRELEKINTYKMAVYYGDNHFKYKEYTSAIYNYKLALKFSPDKSQTYYKLVTIYYYACLDSNIYCDEAITSLTGIINETDTSTYTLKLRSEVYMHLGEYTKAENDLNSIEGIK